MPCRMACLPPKYGPKRFPKHTKMGLGAKTCKTVFLKLLVAGFSFYAKFPAEWWCRKLLGRRSVHREWAFTEASEVFVFVKEEIWPWPCVNQSRLKKTSGVGMCLGSYRPVILANPEHSEKNELSPRQGRNKIRQPLL